MPMMDSTTDIVNLYDFWAVYCLQDHLRITVELQRWTRSVPSGVSWWLSGGCWMFTLISSCCLSLSSGLFSTCMMFDEVRPSTPQTVKRTGIAFNWMTNSVSSVLSCLIYLDNVEGRTVQCSMEDSAVHYTLLGPMVTCQRTYILRSKF